MEPYHRPSRFSTRARYEAGTNTRESGFMPKKVPVPPPPALIDQIKQEVAEPGFLSSLASWTDRQCGRLLAIEGREDQGKATELLHSAVVDTCDGLRTWDPQRKPLRRHLEQVINSRLWHECERNRRRRHIPLDTVSMDDSQDEVGAIVEMSLQREDRRTRPDGSFAQREVRSHLFATMRSLAGQDEELVALLDAYELGDVRRDEAMARLDWNLGTFVNVRRRLETILRRVPEELRAAAIDALTRDGGAPTTSVARRAGRVVEIVADDDADGATDPVDLSSDGASDSTDEQSAA